MENIETVVTAEAQPEAEVDTAKQEQENPAEQISDATPGTIPEGSEGSQEVQETDAVTIPVKFNKQIRELSVEEATDFAEKGLKYDALQPVLQRARYLAASEGKSLQQLIDGLCDAKEQAMRQEFLNKTGDEALADKLLELERAKNQKAYDAVLSSEKAEREQEQENENKRLAEEFLQVKAFFPAIDTFEKLSKTVLKTAAKEGISLLDAQLRYQFTEQKKAEAAKAAQQEAAAASTGSQADNPGGGESQEVSALLKGIWG